MTSVQCYYNLYLPLDFLSILKRGFFVNCYLVPQQLKIYHHLFPFQENPCKVDNSQLLLATILFLFSLIQVLIQVLIQGIIALFLIMDHLHHIMQNILLVPVNPHNKNVSTKYRNNFHYLKPMYKI